MKPFVDRIAAGRQLAALLEQFQRRSDVLVLGLPRGGVPVAFEVAQSLHAPLDVMIVRKLRAPAEPELAIGAIASGGIIVLNEDILAWLNDSEALERAKVADTGATMRAAVRSVRLLGARRIVVALPVASTDAHRMLSSEADEVICIGNPAPFGSVGEWYENFTQTPDEAVTALLALEDGGCSREHAHRLADPPET